MTADIPTLIAVKFWAVVEPTGFCWDWTGNLNREGYGHFSADRKTFRAHRLAYELLVGPIPKGLVLDHLCRNRRCVNPDHLEAVTVRENTLRGYGVTSMQAKQTECVRGHEFTPENTYVTKRGIRQCRACGHVRDRARRAAPEQVERSRQREQARYAKRKQALSAALGVTE